MKTTKKKVRKADPRLVKKYVRPRWWHGTVEGALRLVPGEMVLAGMCPNGVARAQRRGMTGACVRVTRERVHKLSYELIVSFVQHVMTREGYQQFYQRLPGPYATMDMTKTMRALCWEMLSGEEM